MLGCNSDSTHGSLSFRRKEESPNLNSMSFLYGEPRALRYIFSLQKSKKKDAAAIPVALSTFKLCIGKAGQNFKLALSSE